MVREFKIGDRCITLRDHPVDESFRKGRVVILVQRDTMDGWFVRGQSPEYIWLEDWLAHYTEKAKPRTGFGKFVRRIETDG